jgi:hypothetical protein
VTVKYVDLEALNLRSDSVVSEATLLGRLHLGQRVEVLDGAPEAWERIRAEVNGRLVEGMVKKVISPQPATGFVEKVSLRAAESAMREALVAEAVREWNRFAKGLGKESEDPFFRFVGDMWSAIGENHDGRDVDIPWSAAAISFMVRNGARSEARYGRFKFASSHSRYIHDAIVKRQNEDRSVPFWGFRLHEKQPRIGDIVGRWREVPRNFDDAAASDSFKSHCDIIVSISPDFGLAIGGNISESVSISRYAKAASGTLAPSERTFVLLANQG